MILWIRGRAVLIIKLEQIDASHVCWPNGPITVESFQTDQSQSLAIGRVGDCVLSEERW